jgi:hypothetical protein
MVRRYLLAAILLTAAATASWAGITGILTGKVLDKDGKPVPAATVRVLGTTRGANTKTDGKYTIVNVTAGTYDVRVTAVGFDTVVKRVSIIADQTLTLNFTMQSGGVNMRVIDVSADREMVRSTDVGTARVMKGDDMTKIARDNVASAISLNAGIRASGNNFIVRGSRTTETQVLVDGLTVTDQFTGGLGNSGATVSAAMPSPFATEEVQAQTGGFGAEDGNAIGGIVNTVVKTDVMTVLKVLFAGGRTFRSCSVRPRTALRQDIRLRMWWTSRSVVRSASTSPRSSLPSATRIRITGTSDSR